MRDWSPFRVGETSGLLSWKIKEKGRSDDPSHVLRYLR